MRTAALLGLWLLWSTHAVSQATIPEHRDVEFARVDTTRLLLDIYLPDDAPPPYPVIVWVHGGGWRAGSKENVQGIFLTLSGYALVSINYRLSQQSVFPAQIHDCKAAIRWIRARGATYGLDPSHIGVWGNSAGGHLVSLLGTAGPADSLEGEVGSLPEVSSRVQAVCDWYGPSNLKTIILYPSDIDHASPNSPESRLIGAPILFNPELAWRASPIAYVSPDDPPFLIMHGTADVSVPYHQSVELDSALRTAGVPVEFRTYPGEGHGGGVFGTDSVRQDVREFFDRILKPQVTEVESGHLPAAEGAQLAAFPNPFNPGTTILFELPVPTDARLSVYDMLGREVSVLVNGRTEAGVHRVPFDARGLSNGLYFYRLQAGDIVRSGRLVLLK